MEFFLEKWLLRYKTQKYSHTIFDSKDQILFFIYFLISQMFAPHESKLNEKKSSIACELLITFECNTRPRPIYRQKKL